MLLNPFLHILTGRVIIHLNASQNLSLSLSLISILVYVFQVERIQNQLARISLPLANKRQIGIRNTPLSSGLLLRPSVFLNLSLNDSQDLL
jgi:uncharacterized protein YebE (UPF0316 family)